MEDIASCAVANPTGHFHCNKLHVNNLSDCSRTSGIIFHVLRVKKIPMIAPIRIIGAALTNSHSNA